MAVGGKDGICDLMEGALCGYVYVCGVGRGGNNMK